MNANKVEPVVEKSKNFKSLVMLFMVLGIIQILSGITNSFFFDVIPSSLSNVHSADSIFSIILGILLLLCSRVLSKGKVLVIWLLGGGVLLIVVYSFVMGRGLNFAAIAVGALFIWYLFTLKRQGEIS